MCAFRQPNISPVLQSNNTTSWVSLWNHTRPTFLLLQHILCMNEIHMALVWLILCIPLWHTHQLRDLFYCIDETCHQRDATWWRYGGRCSCYVPTEWWPATQLNRPAHNRSCRCTQPYTLHIKRRNECVDSEQNDFSPCLTFHGEQSSSKHCF